MDHYPPFYDLDEDDKGDDNPENSRKITWNFPQENQGSSFIAREFLD